MRYLQTFVISAPIFALLYHWVTVEPLPWWPDTVIMGVFMGALASLVLMRFTFARAVIGPLWRGCANLGRLAFRKKR